VFLWLIRLRRIAFLEFEQKLAFFKSLAGLTFYFFDHGGLKGKL
jgi:hypothetical protein